VFGDDSNLNALSPGTPTGQLPASTAPSAAGGLPLDLFSAFAAPSGSSSQPTPKARQDPMAFFNTVPSQNRPIQQAFGAAPAQLQANNMFGGLEFGNPSSSGSGSSTPMNGFGTGISLPLTPSNVSSNVVKPAMGQQQPAPAPKKDPFADLANW
jgi:hypothetical protein